MFGTLLFRTGLCRTGHSLHSIRGDGSSYNQMDASTEKGMSPEKLALQIQKAVVRGEGNLVVAPLYMKVVVILQYLFPRLVSSIMVRRARKYHSSSCSVCF